MSYKQILGLLLVVSVHFVSAMDLAHSEQLDVPTQNLMRGIQDNNISGVRDAIDAGANTQEPLAFDEYNTDKRTTPLAYAVRNDKHLALVELLLQKGADQKELDTLLKDVAYAGNPRMVELLVAYGARPNDETMKRIYEALQKARSPYTASAQEFKEIIELLESLEPTQKLK